MSNFYSNESLFSIDRASAVPAYQQIASSLIQRITDGEWNIGDRLPTESALSALYGVSRVTLRQALAKLESNHVIEKYQGKGIYVKNNPRHVVQNLSFPSLDIHDSHHLLLESQILSADECVAPNFHIQQKLNAVQDEPLIHFTRLFLNEHKPIGLNNVWLRASMVPGIASEPFVGGSLSKTLLYKYELNVVAIANDIESVRLDVVSAPLLESAYDDLALKIDSQYLLSGRNPVQFASTIWLANYTQLHYEVTK